MRARWARELLTGFARLAGEVVGVVANSPMQLIRRFAAARGQDRRPPRRRHGIAPV